MLTEADLEQEIQNIQRSEAEGLGLIWRGLSRFSIRSVRIITGLVVFFFALWAGGTTWDILGRPFAQQSLLGVIGGLFLGWLTIVLAIFAFSTAFGAGPDADEEYARRRNKALSRKTGRPTPAA